MQAPASSTSAAWRDAFADLPRLAPETIDRMRAHWRLVQAWNARTNLTAVADEASAAWLHYRDSLAAWPLLRGPRVVDFGAGAGYPGLVLAMVDPDLQVTLVEPRRRRASFLLLAAAELGLGGVRVCQARAESPPSGVFDHGVTRATFSGRAFVDRALAWLRPGGTLLCYRAAQPAAWGTPHSYVLGGPGDDRRRRVIDEIRADER